LQPDLPHKLLACFFLVTDLARPSLDGGLLPQPSFKIKDPDLQKRISRGQAL